VGSITLSARDNQYNCYINLIGAIFNQALIDYYNGASEKYKGIPFDKLDTKQRNELRYQKNAINFLDNNKGQPYISILDNFSVEYLKNKWIKYGMDK
jgi:hypothetical protein